MINTIYDNYNSFDFSQKQLNGCSISYEENNLSFKNILDTVKNDIDYNEKKEDLSENCKSCNKESRVKETAGDNNYKNTESVKKDKTEKLSENDDIENSIEKIVDKKSDLKKSKLKSSGIEESVKSSIKKEGLTEELIIDDNKIKLLKNKNKYINLGDEENLLKKLDLKQINDLTEFLKEKIKNIKQNLKKEDKEEIKNILSSLIDLKNLIEEAKTESAAKNKNEKINILKNNIKEEAKGKNLIEETEKLLSDIFKKIKKLDESVLSEVKEIKEAYASAIEKDFKHIKSDEKTDIKQLKSKTDSSGKIDSAFFNEASNSNDNATELTIVKMKDDVFLIGDKLNSQFNEAGKTQNPSKADAAETISKFQDMLAKLVDKAKIAVSEGKSEVIMTLKPNYLGDVRLKLLMEGDKLNAKIFVDNAEIKDIFTKNLDTVISSLNEIDINIEGFDVMLKGETPQNQNGDNDFNIFERDLNIKNSAESYENNIKNNNTAIDRYILEEKKLNILI